jgi:hypothetical protein
MMGVSRRRCNAGLIGYCLQIGKWSTFDAYRADEVWLSGSKSIVAPEMVAEMTLL